MRNIEEDLFVKLDVVKVAMNIEFRKMLTNLGNKGNMIIQKVNFNASQE